MKRLFDNIPLMAITFSLVILFNAIYSLAYGYTEISSLGIIVLSLVIIVLYFVSTAVSYINFKTYKAFYLCNFTAVYVSFLILNYIFNLSPFTLRHMVTNFLSFLGIYYLGYLYLKKKAKLEADEINKKIPKS